MIRGNIRIRWTIVNKPQSCDKHAQSSIDLLLKMYWWHEFPGYSFMFRFINRSLRCRPCRPCTPWIVEHVLAYLLALLPIKQQSVDGVESRDAVAHQLARSTISAAAGGLYRCALWIAGILFSFAFSLVCSSSNRTRWQTQADRQCEEARSKIDDWSRSVPQLATSVHVSHDFTSGIMVRCIQTPPSATAALCHGAVNQSSNRNLLTSRLRKKSSL